LKHPRAAGGRRGTPSAALRSRALELCTPETLIHRSAQMDTDSSGRDGAPPSLPLPLPLSQAFLIADFMYLGGCTLGYLGLIE